MDDLESMDDTAASAAEACRALLDATVIGWEDPGGQRRKSTRLFLADRSVIATRRRSPQRAELEVNVLRQLHGAGAPVPGVLAYEDGWLIQEDLGGERLSRMMRRLGKEASREHLHAALASLDEIHRTARAIGLQRHCRAIGDTTAWLRDFAGAPERLGAFLGIPAPRLDIAAVVAVLERPLEDFVKWDARPPNAIAVKGGGVAWFDWEHCGTRNRLDDIVWFLGDESIIDRPAMENDLLNHWVPRFDDGRYPQGPAAYVMVMGALHCCVRLSIIVTDEARAEAPEDWRTSLYGYGVEELPRTGPRIARRGARWASRHKTTRPLADWF
jgi:aminoglycoside phosphotransferase (APT) family kinase protein